MICSSQECANQEGEAYNRALKARRELKKFGIEPPPV